MNQVQSRHRFGHSARIGLLVGCVSLTLAPGGCGAFRSTKMGYHDSSRKDQVRQGEVVRIVVYKVEDGVGRQEIAAALVPLAGVVLEEAIGFASEELQKHLEKVAALHEASYGGTAVVQWFDPRATYDVHIIRYISGSAREPDYREVAMRAIYRIQPAVLGDPERPVPVIVRRLPVSEFYAEKGRFTHAAARLAREDEPFAAEFSLRFFSVGTRAEEEKIEGSGSVKAGNEKKDQVRVQIGDTLKDQMLVRLGGDLALPKGELHWYCKNQGSIAGENAIGFFLIEDRPQVLEIQIQVTEKDPSRAAERNRAAQEHLKELTPAFVEFVKERAGLNSDE